MCLLNIDVLKLKVISQGKIFQPGNYTIKRQE